MQTASRRMPCGGFLAGGTAYDFKHVIRAADVRGELREFWQVWSERHWRAAVARHEPAEKLVWNRINRFRQDRDLVAAEDCERWLEERDLTPDDLHDYLVQELGAESGLGSNGQSEPRCWVADGAAVRAFRNALLLSEEYEAMARQLAWRVAARMESGWAPDKEGTMPALNLAWDLAGDGQRVLSPDPDWEAELVQFDAAFKARLETALTGSARRRMYDSLRVLFIRFEFEMLELDTASAAREAYLCSSDDGLPLAEVAREAGGVLRGLSVLMEDLPEEWGAAAVSACPGTVMRPLTQEGAFLVCRVKSKQEPGLQDAEVRGRVDGELIRQHFGDLEGRHVQWRISGGAGQ